MNHPFLKAFTPDQSKTLSLLAREIRFREGQVIFRQRDTANGFYLIETGHVRLEFELSRENKHAVPIQIIGPGELLGLSWLFEPYKWEFSATASDDVSAKFFPATAVRQQCEQDPGLGYKLIEEVARVLTQRLQATRHKLRVFVERTTHADETCQVC